jgi:hypothetical protein
MFRVEVFHLRGIRNRGTHSADLSRQGMLLSSAAALLTLDAAGMGSWRWLLGKVPLKF